MVTEIIGRDSSRIQVLLNLLLLFSERFMSSWGTVLLACFVESTVCSAVDQHLSPMLIYIFLRLNKIL